MGDLRLSAIALLKDGFGDYRPTWGAVSFVQKCARQSGPLTPDQVERLIWIFERAGRSDLAKGGQ
jgi:hypothetical protein